MGSIGAPRRLNVGVVGLGGMGSIHAKNMFRLVPRANLVAVSTIVPHEQTWAEENLVPYGVKLHKTFEEFVEDPNLEAVVIASFSSMHVQHTMAALKKGLHVLCEKPLATSAADVSYICPLPLSFSLSLSLAYAHTTHTNQHALGSRGLRIPFAIQKPGHTYVCVYAPF